MTKKTGGEKKEMAHYAVVIEIKRYIALVIPHKHYAVHVFHIEKGDNDSLNNAAKIAVSMANSAFKGFTCKVLTTKEISISERPEKPKK